MIKIPYCDHSVKDICKLGYDMPSVFTDNLIATNNVRNHQRRRLDNSQSRDVCVAGYLLIFPTGVFESRLFFIPKIPCRLNNEDCEDGRRAVKYSPEFRLTPKYDGFRGTESCEKLQHRMRTRHTRSACGVLTRSDRR